MAYNLLNDDNYCETHRRGTDKVSMSMVGSSLLSVGRTGESGLRGIGSHRENQAYRSEKERSRIKSKSYSDRFFHQLSHVGGSSFHPEVDVPSNRISVTRGGDENSFLSAAAAAPNRGEWAPPKNLFQVGRTQAQGENASHAQGVIDSSLGKHNMAQLKASVSSGQLEPAKHPPKVPEPIAPLAVTKALDGTWQYVGLVRPQLETPPTRREIIALEAKFSAIVSYGRSAGVRSRGGHSSGAGDESRNEDSELKNAMAGAGDNLSSIFEQDIMGIRQEVDGLYSRISQIGNLTMEDRDILVESIFEQKWTDLCLGEIQGHVGISCMEQGRILQSIRRRYASVYNRQQEVLRGTLELLCESRDINEGLQSRLLELEKLHRSAERCSTESTEKKLVKLRQEMQELIDEADQRADLSRLQQDKMSDTLRALNGIFVSMRSDTDNARVADLRDACGTMEKRLTDREKELTILRPMKSVNDELRETCDQQAGIIKSLTKELESVRQELGQRDAMVADLMRQEGERLSAVELAGSNGTAASIENEISRGDNNPRLSEIPLPADVKRVEALVTNIDNMLGGEIKKRLPCHGYRVLLPNLMGFRPERSCAWIFRVSRAIITAKMKDNALSCRNDRLRSRFPEFVYAWFQPSLDNLASKPSEKRDEIIAEADEDRWALYYGVKRLARELPEMRLFYNFLDEKYGEDELTFYLHCLRVVDVEAWTKGLGGVNWGGPLIEAANIMQMRDADNRCGWDGLGGGDGRVVNTAENEDEEDGDQDSRIPRVVFISVQAAENVVKEIMTKSTKQEKNALVRRLTSKAISIPANKMPENVSEFISQVGEDQISGEGQSRELLEENAEERKLRRKTGKEMLGLREKASVACVEVGGLLRGLLQEYREEQAHRRAAVRLMFQTAMNPGQNGSDEGTADVTGAVDMQQFSAMVESLHNTVTAVEIAALYRDAHSFGDGGVSYNCFMKAAENRQFFSNCLRLPPYVGAAKNACLLLSEHLSPGAKGPQQDQVLSLSNRSRLASIVIKHSKLFETALGEVYTVLDQVSSARLSTLVFAYQADVDRSGSGLAPDGRRLLASWRRVLDYILYQRMERLEHEGERGNGVHDIVERELSFLEQIARSFRNDPGTLKLRRVMRTVSAIRIQRVWRKFLSRSQGVPLSMRPLMDKDFLAPPKDGLKARPLPWLTSRISIIIQEKLIRDARSDRNYTERMPLRYLLYDFYLYKFGVRRIAERELHELFYNVRRHIKNHPRVKIFSLFFGMGRELGDLQDCDSHEMTLHDKQNTNVASLMGATMTVSDWLESDAALNLYLRLLLSINTAISGPSNAGSGTLYPGTDEEVLRGRSFVPLDILSEVTRKLFGEGNGDGKLVCETLLI